MGKTSGCFDGQSGRVIAKIAADFPKFSNNVLQSVIEEASIESHLVKVFCPVWRDTLPIQKVFAFDSFHFCFGCKVPRKSCPSSLFDISTLRFETFQKNGEGYLRSDERINRLLDSKFLPLSPLMFISLTEKQRNGMFALTKHIREEEGIISCDKFLFSDERAQRTINKETVEKVRREIDFCEMDLHRYFVSAFYLWDARSTDWTIVNNNLCYPPNRPIYSVVMEP